MSKTRDRFSKGKRTENEHVRFLSISKKKCLCPHVQNISFTYVLGHFMEPPVLTGPECS